MADQCKSKIGWREDNEDGICKFILKTVLVGDAGVGKTSLIKQFTNNKFDESISSSINSQYRSKIIEIKQLGKYIKFDIWDTAGQEIYRSLAKLFYKDAKVIILVYDMTRKGSFEDLKQYWYNQIFSNSDKDVILALVGNKNDLYDYQQVDDDEAIKFSDSIGAIFQVTSAKSNYGIDKLFQNVGRKFFNPKFDYKNEEEREKELNNINKQNKMQEKEKEKEDFLENTSTTSVKLYNKNASKKSKKCC